MAELWLKMLTCGLRHNLHSHNLCIVKIHVNNFEDFQGSSRSLLIFSRENSACNWWWRFIFLSFKNLFIKSLKNSRKGLFKRLFQLHLSPSSSLYKKETNFKDVNPRTFEFNENCFRAGGDGDASRWLWNVNSRLFCSSNDWKMFFFYEYWITSMWEDRKTTSYYPRAIMKPNHAQN